MGKASLNSDYCATAEEFELPWRTKLPFPEWNTKY